MKPISQLKTTNIPDISSIYYATPREYLRNLIRSYALNYYFNTNNKTKFYINIKDIIDKIYNKLKSLENKIDNIPTFKSVKKFLDIIYLYENEKDIQYKFNNLFLYRYKFLINLINKINTIITNKNVQRTFLSGDLLNDILKKNKNELNNCINTIIEFYNIKDKNIAQNIIKKLSPDTDDTIEIEYKHQEKLSTKIKLKLLHKLQIPEQIIRKIDLLTIEHIELSNIDPKSHPMYYFISIKEYPQTELIIKTLENIKENYINILSNITKHIDITARTNIFNNEKINTFSKNIQYIINKINYYINQSTNQITDQITDQSTDQSTDQTINQTTYQINNSNIKTDTIEITNTNNININPYITKLYIKNNTLPVNIKLFFNSHSNYTPTISINYSTTKKISYETENINNEEEKIENGFLFRTFGNNRYEWESFYMKKLQKITIAKLSSLLKNIINIKPNTNIEKNNDLFKCIYNQILTIFKSLKFKSSNTNYNLLKFNSLFDIINPKPYYNTKQMETFLISWLLLSNNEINDIINDIDQIISTTIKNNTKNNNINSIINEVLSKIANKYQNQINTNNIIIFNMLKRIFEIFNINTSDCKNYTITNEKTIFEILKLMIGDIYLVDYDYKNTIQWIFVE